MPKKARVLKKLEVDKIKIEGLHAVGGVSGLSLQITGNSRSWILYTMIGGKRRKMGLGSCDDVSLAEARENAHEIRKQIRDGIDPIEERRALKARARLKAVKTKTFQQCAEAYIMAHRAGWVAKNLQQWELSLSNYVYPIIGGLSVANIDTGLVMQILQQPVKEKDGSAGTFWNHRTVTADRVRGRIENILDWARTSGLRESENPARWQGHLEHSLPAKNKVQKVEHFPALPYAEIGAFMVELRKYTGTEARALEFSILTVSRSNEVRLATWEEIDFSARLWTVPGGRMKGRKEHRVPLSDVAIKLLESLPRHEGSGLIFPAQRAATLSNQSLTTVLQRMGYDGITQHGFRSTFRDWAGETTSYPREVIEHALAHKLKDKAEAAYQRGDMFVKRQGLMEAWSRYCDTIQPANVNNVIPMWASR